MFPPDWNHNGKQDPFDWYVDKKIMDESHTHTKKSSSNNKPSSSGYLGFLVFGLLLLFLYLVSLLG